MLAKFDRASPRLGLPADGNTRNKVQFLSDPRSYPDNADRVEVLQTHYSWVFLTQRHAYKLKKPVRGEGFDFRRVEARRRNAVTELRLNRRLAPAVYLGIVALTRQPSGELRLGGDGEPVDWLVKMRRLEADRMLDRRIAHGDWRYAQLEALAHRLAQFFARGRSPEPRPSTYVAQLRSELRRAAAAHGQVGEPRLAGSAKSIVRRLEAFIVRRQPLLRRRVAEGRLIDGHGDLRPEHVYLHGELQIIDCLEFSADLRRLDPVSEIAFLACECDRFGASPVDSRLRHRYIRRSGDHPPRALFRFYRAFNALIRSRLAIEHIADPGGRTRAQWIDRATAYLAVAIKECQRLR